MRNPKEPPFLVFSIAALLIFVCTLPLWILGTQQRAYWTLLLGLYEPEMPEALFIRQCRERWGLPDPFDDA